MDSRRAFERRWDGGESWRTIHEMRLLPRALVGALLLALSAPTLSALQYGRQQGRPQGQQEPRPFEVPKPAPFLIRCTPTTIDSEGQPEEVRNPIKSALELAGPGTIIELNPGDYPAFGIGFSKKSPWNAQASGGTPIKPVIVRAKGRVRVVPGKHGGDTITINQAVPNGHFLFQGITIVPGYRAGLFFFKLEHGASHEGFRFWDCNIEGEWNHIGNSGRTSKWGVWGHSLKDFEFVGKRTPSIIRDLRYEHGFYIQNPRGNVLIENVQAYRLGRTFCQFTARVRDGAAGTGTILVKNCDVRDVGLSRDDGFKGGAAFTIAGRLGGIVQLENNRYRAGFDAQLTQLTRPGKPYGTGAVAIWDAGETERNTLVVLKDNDFEFAQNCGDRAVVSIGGCERAQLLGKNRFVAGNRQRPALELDPVDGTRLRSQANGDVQIARSTQLVGGVELRGKKTSLDKVRRQTAQRTTR